MASEISSVVYAVRCNRCSSLNEVIPLRETDKKELSCVHCGSKLPYPFSKFNPYGWRKEFVSFNSN
ncbi:MAG TPA: hypothetical protein DD435_15225 [Cyanobacteria bacterium UBA8530]|nr:hypothetical protein [Cyanobacteria bacterium UBA8530]